MINFKDFYNAIIYHEYFDVLPVFLGAPPDPSKYENFSIMEINNHNFDYQDMWRTWFTDSISINFNFFYEDEGFVMEKISGLQDCFNTINGYSIMINSFLPVPGSFFNGKNCYAITITIS